LLSARSRIILLQTLVGIIVSYELLFGTGTIIGRTASHLLTGAFVLISVGIMLMPKATLETAWFSGGLIATEYRSCHGRNLFVRQCKFGTVHDLFSRHAHGVFHADSGAHAGSVFDHAADMEMVQMLLRILLISIHKPAS
jgi:hypothetical protein